MRGSAQIPTPCTPPTHHPRAAPPLHATGLCPRVHILPHRNLSQLTPVCATRCPMPFDILAVVPTLPYTLLAPLFRHLSVDSAKVLAESPHPLVSSLAHSRVWQTVSVYSPHAVPDDVRAADRLYFVLLHFDAWVEQQVPLAARIHRLEFVVDADELGTLMTPEGVAYLCRSAHTVALTLDFLHADEEDVASVTANLPALSNLRELALVNRYSNDNHRSGRFLWTDLRAVHFPAGLVSLQITEQVPMSDALRALVIPDSVRTLHLTTEMETPEQLPPLPPGLQSLHLNKTRIDDFSPFVEILPPLLTSIMVLRCDNKPVHVQTAVFASVADRIRNHCLVVVDGDATCLQNVTVRDEWNVLVTPDTDFSNCRFPPVATTVEIVNNTPGVPASLHFASVLPGLSLVRDLEVDELCESVSSVDFPHTLQRLSLCAPLADFPHTVLHLPALEDLAVSVFDGPLRQDPVQNLVQRVPSWCASLQKARFGTAASLKRLLLQKCGLSVLPASILECVHMQKLDLLNNLLDVPGLDFLVLPVSLETLDLSYNTPVVLAPREISFQHLSALTSLDLSCSHLTTAAIALPDSLLSLTILCCNIATLDGVRLPSAFETLCMDSCDMADPWMCPFPDLMTLLSFDDNDGMVPPPQGYVFPPQLEHLHLCNTGITSLAHCEVPDNTHVVID